MRRIDLNLLDRVIRDPQTFNDVRFIVINTNEVNKLCNQIGEARLSGSILANSKPALRDRMLADVMTTMINLSRKTAIDGRGFLRKEPDRSNFNECIELADEMVLQLNQISKLRKREQLQKVATR